VLLCAVAAGQADQPWNTVRLQELGVGLGIDHFNMSAEEVSHQSEAGPPCLRGWNQVLGLHPHAKHPCATALAQVSAKLHRVASEPSFRQSVGRLRDLNLVGSGPASRAADVIESELLVHSSQLLRPIESMTPWWVELSEAMGLGWDCCASSSNLKCRSHSF
jgi:hypothetical protein